jgi:hypothetical protein
MEQCSVCDNDGWVALPLWADKEKKKVRIYKVKCRCGKPTVPENSEGVITLEEFDALRRPN